MPGSLPQIVPAQQPQAPPPDAGGEELSALLATLYEGRWLVGLATLLAVAIGTIYAFTTTPIYKADSLVQVEDKASQAQGLKELSEMFGAEAAASTEIELIGSRAVIAHVVDALHLDIVVKPHYLPFFGKAIARNYHGQGAAPARMNLTSLAWGGEKLVIDELAVPASLEGVTLRLVAGEGGLFRLLAPDGSLLVEGKAGEAAPSKGGEVEIAVATLVARAGTTFDVKKKPRMEAILGFRKGLAVTETGMHTGVISLSLEGADVGEIPRALDELMNAYVGLNIERRAAEAQKTLEFVNAQLPAQKKLLEDAEEKLDAYRQKTGKMELPIEEMAIVSRTTEIEQAISNLMLQREALRQHYTDEHPAVVALNEQLAQLQRRKATIETSARSLPETELHMVRLVRDATVANALYTLLLDKAQEMNLVKSGTVGNVRVVDQAALLPGVVSPKKGRIVLLSLLAGLVLGGVLAVGRKTLLGTGVDDPDVLEHAFGLPVFASVPFSDKQESLTQGVQSGRQPLKALARVDSADMAIESVRSLRTSLQFALASAPNNVIAIVGSRPGVGKSFVSVNLAYVLADTGKKVLLVDGDLRKGHLHRYFAPHREGGLSELIAGSKNLEEAVRKTDLPALSFLSTGILPPNPSELLASDRFGQVVKSLSERFDLIVIDAPPILAVTDSVLLSRVAGVNLLVVKSAVEPIREIALSVSRLKHGGIRPNGFVFNAVRLRDRLYGKYRYHYQYDYR